MLVVRISEGALLGVWIELGASLTSEREREVLDLGRQQLVDRVDQGEVSAAPSFRRARFNTTTVST